MRFRAKFALSSWLWLAVAVFVWILFASGPHRAIGNLRYYVVLYTFIGLSQLLVHQFIWWDILPDGLYERRLWSSRTIPWAEVSHVTFWPNETKPSSSLAICFSRPAPLSAAGQVIATPADRDGFLSVLREHAPQARIEVARSASPIPTL
jgi:hypothetical protein